MTALLVTVVAALAAVGYALYVYRLRELPIRGRGVLAALRAAILVGVVLLLADFALPTPGGGGPPRQWVVVDSSPSMAVAGASGETPGARALNALPGGSDVRVTSFGGAGDRAADGVLTGSRLAPVLRRAAESGAREVQVVTDLRIADLTEVTALRETLALDVRFVDVGEDLRSAGVGGLSVPATGRAGEEVEVEVEVFGTASAEGSDARVVLERDGEVAGEAVVRIPGAGRSVRVPLASTLPDAAGPVLWRARVTLAGDVFEGDDVRSAFTEVDPLEGLLAVVSLRPDWEPRFLMPVLERVTGIPTRGWLRVGDDAFLPMDGSGGVLDAAAMARVVESARLLVVHGLTGAAPDWLMRAQASSRRVVAFAADPAGAEGVGLETDQPRNGEWYPVAASGPLAAALAGVPWSDLPPLRSPLPPDAGGAEALVVERAGGVRAGVIDLQEAEGRRRAVLLAEGFWRWGFRPGVGTDAYDRLWSGVAGWLLATGDDDTGGGVGPLDRVAAADRPIAWRAPGVAGGALEVVTTADAGGTRTDTLAVGGDGRARLPALEPGGYGWTARAVAPDSVAQLDRSWSGRLELERHTDEFRWPRDTTLLAWETGGAGVRAADVGRPLRTSPWPWLLLIGLLAAEWILRRRSGLR
ncbi:hypothetical protein V3331_07860 [Gaopeijia maritima]|uniref:hypothetical protein n=1 Tax=Gaopeijia maritima TaxID=3119007 RepID=UPI00324C136F